MNAALSPLEFFQKHRLFATRLVAILVASHGVFIIADALIDQLFLHHGPRQISAVLIDVPLLIGFSLLYLSSLLHRRKQTAWQAAVLTYVFYLGVSITPLLADLSAHRLTLVTIVRSLILPLTILGLLANLRVEYVVRSDQQGFRSAAQLSVLILVVAFIYGTAGFVLLDNSDFRQEISLPSAMHYTVDQFGLTTPRRIHAYTRRADLFDHSLSFVSAAAVVYAVLAFFQPLRARFSDQSANRAKLKALLDTYGAPSEDYFKLWPHDKQYYFSPSQNSGLAYRVWRGVAICLGDPVGNPKDYAKLLNAFDAMCYQNDWLSTIVHIQATHRNLYEKRGYTLQKLGQEAVVDLAHFEATVARNKYFRHIRNKFTKQGYSAELLQPPHHSAVVARLQDISHEWLTHGGRVERGFAMGYYTGEYMQACPVMVVRDAAGTIQAFLNQLPASFDSDEATYDLLRHTRSSLGNINDFLMLNFITAIRDLGYRRLNLGLCPLTGLDDNQDAERSTVIHNLLRFTYANGDRLYSFSGLYRFKAKYEPEWRDRYVAYRGGIRGFSRSMTALMRAMRIRS